MHLSSVTTVNNGSYGQLEVVLDDKTNLRVVLTEDEAREIQLVGERIYERRQAALAKEVAKPFAALADFTEVDDA